MSRGQFNPRLWEFINYTHHMRRRYFRYHRIKAVVHLNKSQWVKLESKSESGNPEYDGFDTDEVLNPYHSMDIPFRFKKYSWE